MFHYLLGRTCSPRYWYREISRWHFGFGSKNFTSSLWQGFQWQNSGGGFFPSEKALIRNVHHLLHYLNEPFSLHYRIILHWYTCQASLGHSSALQKNWTQLLRYCNSPFCFRKKLPICCVCLNQVVIINCGDLQSGSC